jgi:hypothetical protein
MFSRKKKSSEDEADINAELSDVIGTTPPERRGIVLPFIVALLLSGLLAAQYFWFFQRDQILQNRQIRPTLDWACAVLNCRVPTTRSLKDFTIVQRHLSQHRDRDNALLAHILFENAAFFAQPYPYLELVFVDENQRPVAARRFAPSEYLDDDKRIKQDMPPQQSVHVKLEMLEILPAMHTYGFKINFL